MIQDLIDSYNEQKERLLVARRAQRSEKEPEEQAGKEANLRHLSSLSATIRYENGYVYVFELGGRFYSLCDQTSRVVGESWILQDTEQQAWLEGEREWRDKHDDLGEKIRSAVGYKNEIQGIPLSQWKPQRNLPKTFFNYDHDRQSL